MNTKRDFQKMTVRILFTCKQQNHVIVHRFELFREFNSSCSIQSQIRVLKEVNFKKCKRKGEDKNLTCIK